MLAGVGNGDELLTAVRQLRPDAVLSDIRMPPGHQTEGIEAAHAIRQRYPQTGVVILSQYSDASYAAQLFRNGTDASATCSRPASGSSMTCCTRYAR